MLKTDLRGWLGTRLILLLLLPILAAGCATTPRPDTSATPAASLTPIDLVAGRIEPGVGIAEVSLGMKRAEVEKALGAPTEVDRNEFKEGESFLLYYPEGIELTLQGDSVAQITLHAAQGRWGAYPGATAEGVGVTSTAGEVVAALGAPDEEAPRALMYLKRGLWFRFDQNREDEGDDARVETVSVIAPGG